MLKFWKKKPAETSSEQPTVTAPLDAAATDSADPVLNEALVQVPSPAQVHTDSQPLAGPLVSDAATIEATAAADAPVTAKRSWRDRLSGNAFARGLATLFVRHPKLDDDLLDELETTLITADVGIEAST